MPPLRPQGARRALPALQDLGKRDSQEFVREAARRVGRDVKGVHGDVQALLKAGILQKNEKDLIVFPYDAVHVDFMLKAA